MFRKHINSLNTRHANKVPFYSWECLTIYLKDRSIDLVIRNEEDMKILLRFLVFVLKTINGNYGTALPVIEQIHNKKIREGAVDFHLASVDFAEDKLREDI